MTWEFIMNLDQEHSTGTHQVWMYVRIYIMTAANVKKGSFDEQEFPPFPFFLHENMEHLTDPQDLDDDVIF